MAQQVKRAYKYRFSPAPAQAAELGRTFGCVRLVYNVALEERTRAYREGRRVSYAESSAALTGWKREAARVHARIADRRRDHLHQVTTRLVRENQVIAVEDLAVRTGGGSLVRLLQAVLACGTVRDKLPLRVRTWACACGAVHDRDVNAAKNILAAGLRRGETSVELV